VGLVARDHPSALPTFSGKDKSVEIARTPICDDPVSAIGIRSPGPEDQRRLRVIALTAQE